MTKSKPRWLSSSLIRHMDFNGISPTSSTAPQFSSISIDGLPTQIWGAVFQSSTKTHRSHRVVHFGTLKIGANESQFFRSTGNSLALSESHQSSSDDRNMSCTDLSPPGKQNLSNINSGCIISKILQGDYEATDSSQKLSFHRAYIWK